MQHFVLANRTSFVVGNGCRHPVDNAAAVVNMAAGQHAHWHVCVLSSAHCSHANHTLLVSAAKTVMSNPAHRNVAQVARCYVGCLPRMKISHGPGRTNLVQNFKHAVAS